MLDGISAATEEMACATGVAIGFAHLLRDLGDVDTLDDLAGAGRQLHVLDHWIARPGGFL